MVIHGAVIKNPAPNQFLLDMNSSVLDAGPLPATVSFEDAIEIYWNDTLLAKMQLGSFEIKSGKALIEQQVPVIIENVKAFSEFNKFMVRNAEFTWELKGKAAIRAFGLDVKGLKLEKSIVMPAMDGLNQVTIVEFDLPQDDPKLGIEIVLTSEIINPSTIGVEMGDLEFDIFIPGNRTKLGEATATNVFLTPGANTIPMKGRLVPFNSAKDEKIISNLFTTFLGGIDSKLLCVGKRIRPNSPIEWLSAAFVGLELLVPFKGSDKGDLIKTVSVGNMELDFVNGNPYAPLFSAPKVEATFKMPFNFNLTMKKVQQTVDVTFGSKLLARVATPMASASGSASFGRMTTAISKVPFTSINKNEFSEFLKLVTMSTSATVVRMSGSASVVAGSKIGDMFIEKLPLSTDLSLNGFHGLIPASNPPSIKSVRVVGGDASGIQMEIKVSMFNPSNIKLVIGNVAFDMMYKQQKIGTALVPNLKLDLRENLVTATAFYNPQGEQAKSAGLELLNRYSNRESGIRVDCLGTRDSTKVESLKDTMALIKMPSMQLPPIKEKMILNSRFALTLAALFEKKTVAGMDLFNPFDAPVRITDLQAKVVWIDPKDKSANVVGSISKLDTPFTLQPRSRTRSPQVKMDLEINIESIKAVLAAGHNALFVNVESRITAYISNFGPITLNYNQNDVPTSVTENP